jgi:hypothetical protein
MIKNRSIFSLKNFRGLDKENKPLKVAPFRATDGHNFIIDSETLKTRPAFRLQNEIEFEVTEPILEWYDFKGVRLYISESHFYIVDGDQVYNETNTTKLIKSGIPTILNFEGKKPFFKEEKEVVFIFGLDTIFVFAVIRSLDNLSNHRYVLYDIRYKPANPFTTDYRGYFDNLPKVYVPTLFIGNNPFEDINLLSNEFQYEIFADSNESVEEGKNVYYLPTAYNPTKNLSFEADYEFYKNEFDNIDVYPLFLGINNENFVYNEETYGEQQNDNIPIQDTFYPKSDFEFFGTPTTRTPIKNIYGLTKNEFFTLRTTFQSTFVFEYIMDYILTSIDTTSWVTNKVMIFDLPVEYNAVYRNETDNFVTLIQRERSTVQVYVHLYKFDFSENITFANYGTLSAGSVLSTTNTSGYPSYPTAPVTVDESFTIPNSPIDITTSRPSNIFTSQKMIALSESYLNTIKNAEGNELNNGDIVEVKVQTYFRNEEQVEKFISLETLSQFFEQEIATASYDVSDFPSYPTGFQTDPVSEVIEYSGDYITIFTDYPDDNYGSDFYTQVYNFVNNNLSLLTANEGFAFLKVRVAFDTLENYAVLRSYVIGFEYAKDYTKVDYNLNSWIYFAEIVRAVVPAKDNLYTLTYNEKRGAFEFKVKNFFYDYKNEPSITVKIKMESNPDYDLIARNTFGITFGSENRLFLAGHPNYPNIDRYNVSNDLLGDLIQNQSYELTYFPSRNYRVVGGKGAINGYVVATDTQLYVTKKDYPNDEKLFIRERILTEKGVIGYREFKTNISKTPINERCIVRFYNDIVFLSNDGLYAIELSSNVLTNERLLKLRSGFINKDLKQSVIGKQPFILENNYYMYIFVGDVVYVADSRYVDRNENSIIENQSYEIVKWKLNNQYINGKITETDLFLLDSETGMIYDLDFNNKDQYAVKVFDEVVADAETETSFTWSSTYDYIFDNPSKYTFRFSSGYIGIAYKDVHYTVASNVLTVTDDYAFRNIKDGDVLYNESNVSFTVAGFEDSNRETITLPVGLSLTQIRKNISNTDLYITDVIDDKVRLSLYEPDEIGEETVQYYQRFYNVSDICTITRNDIIEFLWVGNITDMGNNLMEKTLFRINLYATKQALENVIKFGLKTMRRIKRLEDNTEIMLSKQVDASNAFSFEEVEFNLFAINTFNEFGTSIPTKENNFLYIQFMIAGEGQIELNSLEAIYKNNRMLKTVG